MRGIDRSLDNYPSLAAPLRWRNISLTGFTLLHDLPPIEEVQSVNVVPFVGDDCVVIRLKDGSVNLPGGTMELGESFLETARRELREETGGEILDLELVGQWTCHSSDPAPWRPHLPHPDFLRLVLCGAIELVGVPENPLDGEQITQVDVLPLHEAVATLRSMKRPDLADVYALSHAIWTERAGVGQPISRFDALRRDG